MTGAVPCNQRDPLGMKSMVVPECIYPEICLENVNVRDVHKKKKPS